jgi:hypothetical protein
MNNLMVKTAYVVDAVQLQFWWKSVAVFKFQFYKLLALAISQLLMPAALTLLEYHSLPMPMTCQEFEDY